MVYYNTWLILFQNQSLLCLSGLNTGVNVPADSCVGSLRRRCSLSLRESNCFLCAWMLLHVSDMTTQIDRNTSTDGAYSETIKTQVKPRPPSIRPSQKRGVSNKASDQHLDLVTGSSGRSVQKRKHTGGHANQIHKQANISAVFTELWLSRKKKVSLLIPEGSYSDDFFLRTPTSGVAVMKAPRLQLS